MITIEHTALADLPQLMSIFDIARHLMADTGNPNQWIGGYPSQQVIATDIERGASYICRDENGNIVGTFAFIIGDDPTYSYIEDGAWLDDTPYGVIHRVASNGSIKGIGRMCIDWCFSQIPNLRIDTHADNVIMQNIIRSCGFTYCGIIYTHNGTPRFAYQKKTSKIM